MEQIITLREANQHLSRYIEAVANGDDVIITRRGEPVARLVPIDAARRLSEEQRAARERSRERMRAGYPLGGTRVDRDEIYGD